MSWLAFALCGPILWAISVHLDKYLVERYFKDADVIVLLIFTALMGLLLMPVIAWFEPGVFQRDLTSILLMMLSGLFYMTGITFYLRALQNHEASMVAPFFQSSPMFGYVLGYLVLGETLTPLQLLGGALIIGGVLSVSIGSGPKRERFRWQLAALMLCAGFVLSLSTLIFKAFALKDEFWETAFWMFAGEALFGFGFLCIGRYRRQFVICSAQRRRADRAQRLQRTDQSRRRAGQPLRADLCAARHRSGHRLDHDAVRVRHRRAADAAVPRDQPRESLRPRIRAEGHRGDPGRHRRYPGEPLGFSDKLAPARRLELEPNRPAARHSAPSLGRPDFR